MEQINIFATRSFWATAASLFTGLEQYDGGNFQGILALIATILESFGFIPDKQIFVMTVGPVITSLLGLWAYLERLNGKKEVVIGIPAR